MTASSKRVLGALLVSGILTVLCFWFFFETPMDPWWRPFLVWILAAAALHRSLVKMVAEDNLANLYDK